MHVCHTVTIVMWKAIYSLQRFVHVYEFLSNGTGLMTVAKTWSGPAPYCNIYAIQYTPTYII